MNYLSHLIRASYLEYVDHEGQQVADEEDCDDAEEHGGQTLLPCLAPDNTITIDTSGQGNFNRITLRRILKVKDRGPWIHVDNAMDQCSAVFQTVNSVNT